MKKTAGGGHIGGGSSKKAMRSGKRSRHSTAKPSAVRKDMRQQRRRHRKTIQKIGIRGKAGRGSAAKNELGIPEIPESIGNAPAIPRTAPPGKRAARQTSRAKPRRTDRTIRRSTRRHGGDRQRQGKRHGSNVAMLIPCRDRPREIRDGTSGENRCTATANSICGPTPVHALETRISRLSRRPIFGMSNNIHFMRMEIKIRASSDAFSIGAYRDPHGDRAKMRGKNQNLCGSRYAGSKTSRQSGITAIPGGGNAPAGDPHQRSILAKTSTSLS